MIPISAVATLNTLSASLDADRARIEDNRRTNATYDVEIQKKFAISVACAIFVLLGAPVALRFPRGGVGLVIGVSFAVFGLYYVGLIAGEPLAQNGSVSPFWAMWASNVVFLVVGLALLARVGRAGATSRGGELGELMDTIKAWWSNIRIGRSTRPGARGARVVTAIEERTLDEATVGVAREAPTSARPQFTTARRRMTVGPLDAYVFIEWVKIFVTTAIGFPVLVIVIDLTDHLETYLQRNIPTPRIALSYLYWVPGSMFLVLPAAVLFATVFSIGAFTRHSEITAAKASGISFYRHDCARVLRSLSGRRPGSRHRGARPGDQRQARRDPRGAAVPWRQSAIQLRICRGGGPGLQGRRAGRGARLDECRRDRAARRRARLSDVYHVGAERELARRPGWTLGSRRVACCARQHGTI